MVAALGEALVWCMVCRLLSFGGKARLDMLGLSGIMDAGNPDTLIGSHAMGDHLLHEC